MFSSVAGSSRASSAAAASPFFRLWRGAAQRGEGPAGQFVLGAQTHAAGGDGQFEKFPSLGFVAGVAFTETHGRAQSWVAFAGVQGAAQGTACRHEAGFAGLRQATLDVPGGQLLPPRRGRGQSDWAWRARPGRAAKRAVGHRATAPSSRRTAVGTAPPCARRTSQPACVRRRPRTRRRNGGWATSRRNGSAGRAKTQSGKIRCGHAALTGASRGGAQNRPEESSLWSWAGGPAIVERS